MKPGDLIFDAVHAFDTIQHDPHVGASIRAAAANGKSQLAIFLCWLREACPEAHHEAFGPYIVERKLKAANDDTFDSAGPLLTKMTFPED